MVLISRRLPRLLSSPDYHLCALPNRFEYLAYLGIIYFKLTSLFILIVTFRRAVAYVALCNMIGNQSALEVLEAKLVSCHTIYVKIYQVCQFSHRQDHEISVLAAVHNHYPVRGPRKPYLRASTVRGR